MVQFCPGRRQAGALLSTLALAAVLGLYSYRSKSPLRRDGSVTLLHNDAPPPRSPSAAARPGAAELPPGMERSAAWIPTMQPGVVAKNAAIFPSWHQCWAPLCRSCARLIHAPHGDELAGLHVYVLTAGGEQVRSRARTSRSRAANVAFPVLVQNSRQRRSIIPPPPHPPPPFPTPFFLLYRPRCSRRSARCAR